MWFYTTYFGSVRLVYALILYYGNKNIQKIPRYRERKVIKLKHSNNKI